VYLPSPSMSISTGIVNANGSTRKPFSMPITGASGRSPSTRDDRPSRGIDQ
jgi:hypothetical protein